MFRLTITPEQNFIGSLQCLAILINRKLQSTDVIDVLSDLFMMRGIPTHVRSDNGLEFIAQGLRDWLAAVGSKTAYTMPGSPWGETVWKSLQWSGFRSNGYCERFNSKLRDELLNGGIFYTLKEAKIVIETRWRHYNTIRPHSSLRYQPPAPEVLQ